MTNCFDVYYDWKEKLKLQSNEATSGDLGRIVKIFHISNKILFLNHRSELHLGSLRGDDSVYSKNSNLVSVQLLKDTILDLDYNYPMIYIVNQEGDVFKTIIEKLQDDDWTRISFYEDKPEIRKVNVNNDGILFTSDNSLYGCGNFGNVLKSDEPKKIQCFENMNISQVATGDNFTVVLLQHKLFTSSESSTDEVQNSLRSGKSALKTEVWSFGSVNKGMLGIGDHINRAESKPVFGLAGIGVYKIGCGMHHGYALTLDGRLFLWGSNLQLQLSDEEHVSDCSAPIEFKLNVPKSKDAWSGNQVLESCCGSLSTIILLNNLNFKILKKPNADQLEEEKSLKADDSFENNLKYEVEPSESETQGLEHVPYILSHGRILVVNKKNVSQFLLKYLSEEQGHVQTLILGYYKIIKVINKNYDDVGKLVECYEKILFFHMNNLKQILVLLQSNNGEQRLQSIFLNSKFEVVLEEYYKYLIHLCDIKSSYSYEKFAKHFSEPTIRNVLEQLFSSLQNYEKLFVLIYDLKLYENCTADALFNGEVESLKAQVTAKKKQIKDFEESVNHQVEDAENTFRFWASLNESHIRQEMFRKERRFVLDSQSVPLKLLERTNLFSTNRFILFNDHLVCLLNKIEYIPLNLVWILNYNVTGKHSFKIITPEAQLKVFALTLVDKKHWITKLKICIQKSLQLDNNSKGMPMVRTGPYRFTERNAKYSNYDVLYGKWLEGKFFDLCEIKILSSNRIFKCRIAKAGELHGTGIIIDNNQNFSYAGQFVNGLLHGFGSYENKKTNQLFKGFFRNDKFSGFGTLIENSAEYCGEFAQGQKFGYGVLDETINGNKYMGMFTDAKKHGAGVYIKMDGSYFEGKFNNDVLSGEGLAIFPDGKYYIGDFTLQGPSGHGSLFIPETEIAEEIIDLDDRSLKMKGYILKGVLSGTWDNVQINTGHMLMNQIFLKTPISINYLNIKSERKCEVLFENFLDSTFGKTTVEGVIKDIPAVLERWNCISMKMTRKKRFNIDLMYKFEPKSIPTKNFENSVLIDSVSTTNVQRSNSMIDLKEHNRSYLPLKKKDEDSISVTSSKLTMNKDLDFVPSFISSELNSSQILELRNYLKDSLDSEIHPLHDLICSVRTTFTTSYGNWRCKPTRILAKMAMEEWIAIVKKFYSVLVLLFPGLSNEQPDNRLSWSFEAGQEAEEDTAAIKVTSPLNFLHPILLNADIYSALFLLYASKSSQQDETYRLRLKSCELKTDKELCSFLKIEGEVTPLLEDPEFASAIKSFQQITEKFCPSEMLELIQETFKIINNISNKLSTKNELLNADNLLSVTIYLIIKSNLPHLGAELSLLEDLMDSDMEKIINSHCGYIYTTVKISYLHIVSGQFFQN